jgi:hypothetical protein
MTDYFNFDRKPRWPSNKSIDRNPLLIMEESPRATEEDKKKFQRSIGKLIKRSKSQ